MWAEILGGLGVFLIGMSLMTDGLRQAAGDRFIAILERLTKNRFGAVGTGVMITAILQSSSATTLTTIGLVSAGLMSFVGAVGVVFGANIGTTATSWLVATIGLKFKITAYAFPMVGIGALAKLLGRGPWRDAGGALAGFGLIFVGIDLLQAGMGGLSDVLDPTTLPSEGLVGALVMVALGVVMTVIMQSSSAAVATTLTALSTGAIGLYAAAAMVIGQNVGTTVTAAIGAVGGNVAAKRTAAAHVAFNVATGVIAMLLLPVFLAAAKEVADGDPAVQIAVFHTMFNIMGVLVLLPFIHGFCARIEKWFPGDDLEELVELHDSTLKIPAVALQAARRVSFEILHRACDLILSRFDGEVKAAEYTAEIQKLRVSHKALRDFVMRIETGAEYEGQVATHVSTLHAVDHLGRLLRSAERDSLFRTTTDAAVLAVSEQLEDILQKAVISNEDSDDAEYELVSASIANQRRETRKRLFDAAARNGGQDVDASVRRVSRTDRVAYHLWRFMVHMKNAEAEADLGVDALKEEE